MVFFKVKDKNLFISSLFIPEDLFCKSFFTIQYTLGNKIKAITLVAIYIIEFGFFDKKFAEIICK